MSRSPASVVLLVVATLLAAPLLFTTPRYTPRPPPPSLGGTQASEQYQPPPTTPDAVKLREPPVNVSAVPVVFVALGTSCVQQHIVEAATRHAHLVVLILGDPVSCYELYATVPQDKIEIVPTEDLPSADLAALDNAYGKDAPNRAFELFCFQRYVYLRQVIKLLKLTTVLYLDSDVVLYHDPTELWTSTVQLTNPHYPLNGTIFLTHGCSLTSFWHQNTLDDMVRFMIYILKTHWEPGYNDMRITKMYAAIAAGTLEFPSANNPGNTPIIVPTSVSFRPSFQVAAIPVEPSDQSDTDLIVVDRKLRALDVWAGLPEVSNFGDGQLHIKRVFYCRGGIYFHHIATGKLVRSATIHFQGKSKPLGKDYSLSSHSNCVCTTESCQKCLPYRLWADSVGESDPALAKQVRELCS